MNIFFLSLKPEDAAQQACDKHVIKMILESTQLLYTAQGLTLINNLEENPYEPYKPTHKNHPCTLWLNESLDNFYWLCDLGIAICKEYTFRYSKVHKCEGIINWCRDNAPSILSIGLTKQALAMPEPCKIPSDIVLSYRNYYIKEKAHLHSWKNRTKPYWINNLIK
jgi:hypothetical protein